MITLLDRATTAGHSGNLWKDVAAVVVAERKQEQGQRICQTTFFPASLSRVSSSVSTPPDTIFCHTPDADNKFHCYKN